ncbi:MAG: ABC transporter permease [Bryobacteraceae bacterium]|jgi:predicted permease
MGLLGDLAYGFRSFQRNRAFAFVAAISLALGIGVNTTIFTLVNSVLLAPLPVDRPRQLAEVYTVDSHVPGAWLVSYPNYKDYRDRNTVFSELMLSCAVGINLTGRGEPQLLVAQLVSGNYFAGLGVRPLAGRALGPLDDMEGGSSPVTVISYGLWARLFDRDPRITERTLELNGLSYRIVGVAPKEFRGLDLLYGADAWLPMATYPRAFPIPAWVNQRRVQVFAVTGRLKPGVGLSRAEASLNALAAELEREYPRENDGKRIRLEGISRALVADALRPGIANAGSVLMIVSGLVLLIACANVANLLLARAAGRTREIGIRLALGASRFRLIRQLLTESVLLAVVGGSLALLLAWWAGGALWAWRPEPWKYAIAQPQLDKRVLGYNLAISIATGLLFGLFPALRATRSGLATDLKERTGQPPAAGQRFSPRSLLVMAQVALSLIALIGAGLFVRSVWDADQLNPGFDAAHLGTVSFNLGDQAYSEDRGREYQQRALEVARQTPGVDSAALAKDAPFTLTSRNVLLAGRENSRPGVGWPTYVKVVGPGYFAALRIPIVAGRDFSLFDRKSAPRVAVVNQAAAAHFWPGRSAVGQMIAFAGENLPVQVVAVVRTANYLALGETPQPLIYLSLMQYYFPTTVLYLHTPGDPAPAAMAVRRQLQPLDRNLLLRGESLREFIHEVLWPQRVAASLLTAFGTLALLLATIGVYGVISYSVAQRVREIGLRMALGAEPAAVERLIVLEGVRMVVIGAIVGLLVALAISRSVAGMLVVTNPRDGMTFVLVPAILILVGVMACWLPARRATRIDPAKALREE